MEEFSKFYGFLGRVSEKHAILKENQDFLDSPFFSCRGKSFADIEELETTSDLARALTDLDAVKMDVMSQMVFVNIDRLKLAIYIMDMQTELSLRSDQGVFFQNPNNAWQKISVLLSDAETLKSRLEDSGAFELSASERLRTFFEHAHSHLASGVHAESCSEFMEMGLQDFQDRILYKRLELCAFSVHATRLRLGEVEKIQSTCVQLEKAILRKILPDNEVSRQTIQDFRTFCRSTINRANQDLINARIFAKEIFDILEAKTSPQRQAQKTPSLSLDLVL